jgi:hypothetical protein
MSDYIVDVLLDMMRSISTIASVFIVGKAVESGIKELFTMQCDRCNGMGKIICRSCYGTNTLAKRPAQKVPNLQIFNRRHEDLRVCFVCGPNALYDFEDCFNEGYEYEIVKNTVDKAILNRPSPRNKPLAGSTFCPICRGQCSIWYTIPVLSKLFGQEEVWYMKPLRNGVHAHVPIAWPQPHSNYMEWSGKPLRPITEREIGYFGQDVFDYEDQMYEETRKKMDDEFKKNFKNSNIEKEKEYSQIYKEGRRNPAKEDIYVQS